MATQLQEVYDAFFAKVPTHDFTDEESYVFQIFKSSVGYSKMTVSDDLTYTADASYEGSFGGILDDNTIELIALYMLKEWYRRDVGRFDGIKAQIGTKDFNKRPDLKVPYDIAKSKLDSTDSEIYRFRQEFYSYGNS